MDLIDKRDEVLRTFLEYGITECDWCGLRKTDLADCAEAIVKKLTTPVVSNCAVWHPTMMLRWYETDNYNPVNDDFDKVLQQKWQSNTGEEKWEDIEVYGR